MDLASANKVEVTINAQKKILHFGDGVEEVIEEHEVGELNAQNSVQEVDPKALDWVPWLSHYATSSSTKVLNAVDYMGEGLASFFGITTPKYQIEIDEYERLENEKKKMDEESAGWVPKNTDGEVPLVMNEPSRVSDRPTPV